MTEAVQQLAKQIRCVVSSLARSAAYPVMGAALALVTPTYILIAHLVMTGGVASAPWSLDGLVPEQASQAYLTLLTAVLAVVGFVIGRKIDRLRSLSITDPLTGLFNRRQLSERLEQEVSRRSRYGTSFSLVALDLDGLKLINDSFGHKAGDSALLAVAESISGSVRTGDIAARVGGDEFVIILAEAAVAEANIFAQRIAATLVKRRGPWQSPLSVSIGVTDVNRAGEMRSEDLLAVADAALYQAKLARGGRAVAAREEAVVAFSAGFLDC